MKRSLLFLLLVCSAVPAQTADKSDFQAGKLVDFRREGTSSGAARAQGSFCLAVEVGDMTYLLRHEAYWRWSYEPTDFVVGDPVEVQIKGKDMYVKKPKSGVLKAHITRRERNASGKETPKCGVPITSN